MSPVSGKVARHGITAKHVVEGGPGNFFKARGQRRVGGQRRGFERGGGAVASMPYWLNVKTSEKALQLHVVTVFLFSN